MSVKGSLKMRLKFFVPAIVSASLCAVGAQAAVIDYSTNLALQSNGGVGITGVSQTPTTGGISYVQTFADPNISKMANINDGNTGTRAQTWYSPDNGAGGVRDPWHPYDYAGVTWAGTQDDIAAVRIRLATFNDGGWFATPDRNDPAYNGTRYDDISFYPLIQYTTDGGTTWLSVTNQVDDYDALAATISTGQGTAVLRDAATFTFDPVSGINGIRIIGDGYDGLSGADDNGFLGIFEFEAYAAVPEPASLMLLAIGGVLALHRRSREAANRG